MHITLLILVGIITVLIFTLWGLALLELEYDDFPLIKSNPITHIRGIPSGRTLLSGFELGVFALILLFEFLRVHIGEKRFTDETGEVSFPFQIYFWFLTTARSGPSFVFNVSEGP